ncbi:MAG: sigma factor-like helix-turn-helix DNA-binding protein, partial [Candidatus Latescibacterota bacterium]|nr:sigma factor-like helix-turn-helix DNA-binding protein [Candidatus Latescibacterota bacterium]
PAWMIDVSTAAPDEALSRSEHRRMLQSIVGGLPHDKQVVMRMVDEAHMETRQVADELRIPVATVKSRQFQARQQIARSWKEMDIDWEDFE